MAATRSMRSVSPAAGRVSDARPMHPGRVVAPGQQLELEICQEGGGRAVVVGTIDAVPLAGVGWSGNAYRNVRRADKRTAREKAIGASGRRACRR